MNGTFSTVREVTDYGPFIRKVILPLPMTVSAEAAGKDTFMMHVTRRDILTGEVLWEKPEWMDTDPVESRGYCPLSDGYVSDETGERQDRGEYVTLVPAIHRLASELAMVGEHNVRVFCDMTITQTREMAAGETLLTGLVFDRLRSTSLAESEGWTDVTARQGSPALGYGFFTPRSGSGNHPLIIWLHGAGEGGKDPAVAYTGNRVVHLSSPAVQELFGGAYVLAPQVPTMWMDNGSGEYTRTGKSMYLKALKALIDEFVEIHGDIDRSRIYLGGCSNGGFMTMRMIIDYPEYFAGAFPVCEALFDELISEGDIAVLKEKPIWFTHARNDIIVNPEETVLPTYARLKKAGASGLHFSFFDSVPDRLGYFTDGRGEVPEFLGHFAWTLLFNGKCDFDYDGSPVREKEKKVNLLEWLSRQKLGGKQ